MTDQVVLPPQIESESEPPKQVTDEEYQEKYAHDHYEWDNGELIEMSPITGEHNEIDMYLMDLFRAYFHFRNIGVVRHEPFMMRLDDLKVRREPDLQIILNDNPGKLTKTAMIGPADICIEIVSPESVERDYGKKFTEYEQGGVKEYWLLDYLRRTANFHRLNEQKLYSMQLLDADSNYESPLLPGLKVHVPTLWTDPLPDYYAIGESVRAMIEG